MRSCAFIWDNIATQTLDYIAYGYSDCNEDKRGKNNKITIVP